MQVRRKSKGKRKLICVIGCLVPLLSLFFFKYYHFITESTSSLLSQLGVGVSFPKFEFLLPLGISFYSFTAIGYLIDVYRNKYQAESNFGIFALFVAFFAQIASGPIPRGDQLLPQLKNTPDIEYNNIIGGLHKMLWGFFMKLCVGDRLGIYVDTIYSNVEHHNGTSLFLASLLYSIQIYCDFAGYSLIAIGVAKMLGIRLVENFRRPYFSKSIKEFWSRWHISLSTWFRDYVYIPLGGNRVSKGRNYFNLIATFLVSGLWHGAAWNFILWGGLHGVGQATEKIVKYKTPPPIVKICLIFVVINFLWVFFRLESISQVGTAIYKIFTDIGYPFMDVTLVYGLLSLALLFIKDYIDEYHPGVKLMSSQNIVVSSVATGCLVAIIILFGVFDNGSFIYFQF